MWEDLVCPVDHGDLHGHGDWLACRKCGRGFPVLDGIPTFLSADEGEAWCLAQQRRIDRLPEATDDSTSPRTAAVRRRGRALEARMSRHVELGPATRILQIGLHREAELHHFHCGVRFGVEPLAGVLAARGLLRWGQVRWVSGRGEELPFADGAFKVVLLGNVLEHVEAPARVLAEACRCLAADGLLWLSCRTIGRGWRAMLGRLLGWGEVAETVRQCNRTTAVLLRQCRHAGLKRVWAGADEVDAATIEPTNVPPVGVGSSWTRKEFVFHSGHGGMERRRQACDMDTAAA